MKKFAIALIAFTVLVGFVSYNVWRAVNDPVSAPPGPLEIGRQQLHTELEQAKAREGEIEKQDWNSVTLLRDVIKAHQHRIEQLSGNSQAGEIVAYDRESVARLEKRLSDLEAQEAARPRAEDQAAAQSAQSPHEQKQ
jgi:TolA-binding protein